MQKLKEMPFALSGEIENGPGFQIGTDTNTFAFPVSDEAGSIFGDPETGLRMHIRIEERDNTLVVSSILKNESESYIYGINRIDPLHLVFRKPSSEWRHIYALGGTTEHFYPPHAYRTIEQAQDRRSFRIESHELGRSSNLHLPLLISLADKSADSEGLFCGIEWSGAWHITFASESDGRSSLRAGVKLAGIALAPGEVLILPNIHLGFFKGGPDAGTNALRKYLYRHVCPEYQGKRLLPRVSYDHWFGIGNNLNMDVLKRQATRAADLGVEVFVVDAAWFPGGFHDGVGNWNDVDQAKFPDGLESLADYVRSQGMDFGLWFEIECANKGTRALLENPELFIPKPAHAQSKRAAHLNLARRDAQEWAIETIGSWIQRLDLRWSRWDYNVEPQCFWDAVDPSGKIQFQYMEGLYNVLDTLMSRYPNWMVEGCASGGRRIDIGTLKRSHTLWFSDQTSVASNCRYMQARANRFLPGHLLNSSVAVDWEEGDAGFNDTAVLSRMLGKLAFDGDVASWSPELAQRMAKWSKEFKNIRHLLVQDFYQLLSIPTTTDDFDAVQFVSYSGDEAAVFVFAGATGGSIRLRLRGLDRDVNYEVSHILGEAVSTYPGAALMEEGFCIDLASDEAGLWRIIN